MAYLYFSRKICCKLRNFLKEQFVEIRLVNLNTLQEKTTLGERIKSNFEILYNLHKSALRIFLLNLEIPNKFSGNIFAFVFA